MPRSARKRAVPAKPALCLGYADAHMAVIAAYGLDNMHRFRSPLAFLIALMLLLTPALVEARLGGGSSMGSRGSRTYSAPAPTNTAPYTAAPFQRSMTPSQPSSPYAPGIGAPMSQGSGGRSPFMSGLMGGLIGAGIGGLLFGGGMFHGIGSFGGFLGLLLQIFLVVMVVRLLLGWWRNRQPAMASGPGIFARGPAGPQPGGGAAAARATARPVAITPADYKYFEQTLIAAQAAWTAHNLNSLRAITTPEMLSYFAEQLADQNSRGVRNEVSDVRLLMGDLSEAWAEGGREYATVAMRFSMVDVTRDGSGRIVDGSPTEHVTATELWTFMRAAGGRWVLSGIQQAR